MSKHITHSAASRHGYRSAILILVLQAFVLSGCVRHTGTSVSSSAKDVRIANLHAFARLYGVVRWFHPSDAAASLDWNRFAIEGTNAVIDAPDGPTLRHRLLRLFQDFAPTVRVCEKRDVHAMRTLSQDTPEPPGVLAWQHRGFGDTTTNSDYVSKRLGRSRDAVVSGDPIAAVSQAIEAAPYHGMSFRLRGKLRTKDGSEARLWVRVDRNDTTLYFDNMAQRAIISDTWEDGEVIAPVDTRATQIAFGILMIDTGVTWYDDLTIEARDASGVWHPIPLPNGGFEEGDVFSSWQRGVNKSSRSSSLSGWIVESDRTIKFSGNASLRVGTATKHITGPLFAARPQDGEVSEIDLGQGLWAYVPIVLPLGEGQEEGRDGSPAHPRVSHLPNSFERRVGIADVIVVWNALEHFWPYWNLVDTDWPAHLDRVLADALRDHDMTGHLATLERLSTGAPDGHADTRCPHIATQGFPPFSLAFAEGHLVVTASEATEIQRGDVVLTVDGQRADVHLALEEMQVSGSPQWRQLKAIERLWRGPIGTPLRVSVLRDSASHVSTVARIGHAVPEEPRYGPIELLKDGVYYVDLRRTSMAMLKAAMDRLVSASGIVFDVRGRPNRNHDILSHLATHVERVPAWEQVPLIIRPGSASRPAAWEDTSIENMPQLHVSTPHIAGRVAFVVDAHAISYAESLLSLVEHYQLGALVGEASAGTNGDVAQVSEPSGCVTTFTGRKVSRLDGTRQHLLGIRPTVPAVRTIAGIRAGRDEQLDRALRFVRDGR